VGLNPLKIFVLTENRVIAAQHSRGNIAPKLGVWMLGFFWDISNPCISELLETPKQVEQVNYWKSKDLQIWFYTLFRYLQRFLRYFEKKMFLKKVCPGLGVEKTSWRGSKYVQNGCFNWESSLPCTAQSGQYFPKIRGGGVFCAFSNPYISIMVGNIKMCPGSKLLLIKWPTNIGIIHFFDIPDGFWDTTEENCFWKKVR